MKKSEAILRSIALALAVLLAAQFAAASPWQQQQGASDPQLQGAPASKTEPQNVDTPNAPRPQYIAQSGQADTQQPTSDTSQSTSSEQHPNPPSQPVGTAAAPYEKPTGVAASRPSGAVIAPGKQRREHAIVIRVAIVVGAAVAVGTVVALSHSSSGRP